MTKIISRQRECESVHMISAFDGIKSRILVWLNEIDHMIHHDIAESHRKMIPIACLFVPNNLHEI